MKKADFYENLAHYYDFICEDRKRDVAILEGLIRRHLKSPGNRLLDVACGTGLEDLYLKKHYGVTGIDLHQGVLRIAKQRNPEVKYKKGDARTIRLHQRFDIITCFDALMHLRSLRALRQAFENFHRHLADGGTLIFYIDGTFLKGEIGNKSKIIIERKTKGNREITLMLTYRRKGTVIEGQDIFFIKEKGKTKIEIEPKSVYGSFEIKTMLKILRETGFVVHLYSGNQQTTFTLKKWNKKAPFPILVCEKPLKTHDS